MTIWEKKEEELKLLVGKVVLFKSFSVAYSALFSETDNELEKLSNNTTLLTSSLSFSSFFSHLTTMLLYKNFVLFYFLHYTCIYSSNSPNLPIYVYMCIRAILYARTNNCVDQFKLLTDFKVTFDDLIFSDCLNPQGYRHLWWKCNFWSKLWVKISFCFL